mmetsp:Transcript_25030/g.87265  ORF Transcript_25030/g.87265 Transcript_25030/m.87265 type:complete len:367 (+) Transcript_25030:579-1679(+)
MRHALQVPLQLAMRVSVDCARWRRLRRSGSRGARGSSLRGGGLRGAFSRRLLELLSLTTQSSLTLGSSSRVTPRLAQSCGQRRLATGRLIKRRLQRGGLLGRAVPFSRQLAFKPPQVCFSCGASSSNGLPDRVALRFTPGALSLSLKLAHLLFQRSCASLSGCRCLLCCGQARVESALQALEPLLARLLLRLDVSQLGFQRGNLRLELGAVARSRRARAFSRRASRFQLSNLVPQHFGFVCRLARPRQVRVFSSQITIELLCSSVEPRNLVSLGTRLFLGRYGTRLGVRDFASQRCHSLRVLAPLRFQFFRQLRQLRARLFGLCPRCSKLALHALLARLEMGRFALQRFKLLFGRAQRVLARFRFV